jgi:hypothetical protein
MPSAPGFYALAWAFVVVVAIHNLEEALLLPKWSGSAGRWHAEVGETEFCFAVTVLTIMAALFAILAVERSEVGIYLLCGYALAMALNVLFPHVAATVALRRYAPGTATAILLNLPVCVMLLIAAGHEHLLSWKSFAWVAPLVIAAMLGSIPLLFHIGRAIGGSRARDQSTPERQGTDRGPSAARRRA